jgi:hypothetical protein
MGSASDRAMDSAAPAIYEAGGMGVKLSSGRNRRATGSPAGHLVCGGVSRKS